MSHSHWHRGQALEPDITQGRQIRSIVLANIREFEQVTIELSRLDEGLLSQVDRRVFKRYVDILMAVDARNSERTRSLLNEAIADPESGPGDYLLLLASLSEHGLVEEAFELIEWNVATGGKALPFDNMVIHPQYAVLRNDPRFMELQAQSRPAFDRMLEILEDARQQDELPGFLDLALQDLLQRLEGTGAV